MSEMRQPQPEEGMTGYAARWQQFDTAAPWAPAPAVPFAGPVADPASFAAEPDLGPTDPYAGYGTILGVAAVPQHPVDVVPAEVYELRPARTPSLDRALALPEPAYVARIFTSEPVPAPVPGPVRRPRPARRRLLAAVATVVALAGLGAVGAGYVTFTRTARSSPQAKAQAIPEVPPLAGTLPGGSGVSGTDPVVTPPASQAVAASTSAPTTRATTASAAATTGAPTAKATRPAPGVGNTDTASPAGTEPPQAAPLLLMPPAATAGTLEATFSYTATKSDSGISNYQGTIEIDSTQPSDAASWRLTLTVPGGNQVAPDGPVVVSQDGEQVQFGPGDGGAIPAGGSLTFTFTVSGVLSDVPANCMIDGVPATETWRGSRERPECDGAVSASVDRLG